MDHISTKCSRSAKIWRRLGALCLLLVSFAGFGQAKSYTWRQPSNGSSWADANNWSPARTVPGTDDILVFDGTVTRTAAVNVDFTTSQTIGQLVFINGVNAALSTDADRTLTIGGQSSTIGVILGAGAQVQVIGTQGGAGLKVQLAANTKAGIAGRLEFMGLGSTGSPHQLLSSTPGAIEFMTGSYFLGGSKFIGFPFGELLASAGAVVFHSGATFEQFSGGSAFGGKTWSVAVFDSGSLFLFSASSGTVGVSNRTFGYLTINTARTAPVASFSAGTLLIRNDLTITAGTHPFNVQNFEVQGNIVLSGGNLTLTSIDTNTGVLQASTLTFNGTTPQSITGTGTVATGPNINAVGLTLQRPLQINANLTFAQGLLTTTATNNLTLGSAAVISGAGPARFVSGPLSRLQTGTAVNLFFPIGSGKAYRPLTLTGQQADASTTYTAQQFNQAPTARAYPTAAGSLQRVSRVRYFNVTNNGATNFSQGAITLNYDADDRVDAPAKLRIAKSDAAGNWLDLGGTGTGAPTGSITSTVPFTSFSDFALASTEASGALGNNPLPVELTTFTARRQAAGVQLQWATATELNNSYFEAQRSTDGQFFGALAKVPGHGSSTSPQAYTFLDKNAPTGTTLYYRLRQVDADGTASYSPVAAVRPGPAQAGIFPNPAHQQISFSADAGDNYRLLNVLGQPLLAGRAVAGFNSLELSSLGAGAYYLEVIGSAGRERFRFFKN